MDAKTVRNISKLIYSCFTRLNRDSVEDFNHECLPSLVSEIMTEVCKNHDIRERAPEEFRNCLVNKTFELCKFLDSVKIEDIRMLYRIVGPVVEMRYINYESNYTQNKHIRAGQDVSILEAILYNQPDEIIEALFTNIEDTEYPEIKYPKYYIKNDNNLIEVSEFMIKHLKGTGHKISYGIKKDKYSHIYEHHLNCDDENCNVCNLSICMCCGQAEGELTTHCYGQLMLDHRLIRICYENDVLNISNLDFMFGQWFKSQKLKTNPAEYTKLFRGEMFSLFEKMKNDMKLDVETYLDFVNYLDNLCKNYDITCDIFKNIIDEIYSGLLIDKLKFRPGDLDIFTRGELSKFVENLKKLNYKHKFYLNHKQTEELVNYYKNLMIKLNLFTAEYDDYITKIIKGLN